LSALISYHLNHDPHIKSRIETLDPAIHPTTTTTTTTTISAPTMPDLPTIRKGIASLPTGAPLVVALAGGTTGIGSYTARALARAFAEHGEKLRVYVIGRNASRAEELLKYGKETAPGSEWRFVKAGNMALMSEVSNVSRTVIEMEESAPFAGGPARLDVLYMSQALSPFQESPSEYYVALHMHTSVYQTIRQKRIR
jgi:hypothetical protein